jgi:FtsZ-binding cell division protein ZapB
MDETDIIEMNDNLTKENASLVEKTAAFEAEIEKLEASLSEANEKVTTIAAENAELKEQVHTSTEAAATAAQERDALKAENDKLTKANADLQASQEDFDKAVAAKVAEHGIASEAVAEAPKQAEQKQTLTERARAAKAGQA